jgi:hypothetical protein
MVAKSAQIYLYYKDEWENKMARLCVWIAKTIRKMKLARWRGEDLHKYTTTRAAEEFSNIIHLFRD